MLLRLWSTPYFAISIFVFLWLTLFPSPISHAQEQIPGTSNPATALGSREQPQAINSLTPLVTESGRIRPSIDAIGTNASSGGKVQVDKAPGATVRSAYLIAASTGETGYHIGNNEVSIDGTGITWQRSLASSINSFNYWADVTQVVKDKIDNAPAGLIDFTITETDTLNVDGEILAVIFDDPAQTSETTIVLFFGAQNVNGDIFNIRLSEPINLSQPDLILDLSLGISYGFQRTSQRNQDSQIDVNGQRMTSSAGGDDDTVESENGALITVGGIGDTNTNPADPFSRDNNDVRQDDELYDLRPFVDNGDTQIQISTSNPSDDDNILFAALTLSSSAAIIGEGILVTPTSSTATVGETQTFTAIVQDDNGNPVTNRTVTFEILSGPHAGMTQNGQTDTNGRFAYTYTGTAPGVDNLVARFVDSQGTTQASNQATNEWQVQFSPDSIAQLEAESVCSLLNDNDSNGVVSAGDDIRCNISITNRGSAMAMSVEYRNNLVPDVRLINGSVLPSQGSVTEGNATTDTTILVTLGNITAGASATVQFDATILASIPDTLGFIAIPGYVSCVEHPIVSPSRPGNAPGEAGIVIGSRPLISAQKDFSLVVDLNGDGAPGPGDTLEYSATLFNSGTDTAPDSNFIDQLDPNTTLIVGSVTSTGGDILIGNELGDSTVDVQVGSIEPGASVTITFRVRINPALSSTITRLSNLAVCIYGNAPPACVGQPGANNSCTPSFTTIGLVPQFSTIKRGALFVDADQNGIASPGDTLVYQVRIKNDGNTAATGVRFSDPLAAYLAPQPNTVRINRGAILSGNEISDRAVEVEIGQLAPGDEAIISFQLQLTDVMPPATTFIQNQGTLSSNELPSITFGDAGIPASGEVGGSSASTSPILTMSKNVIQTEDVGLAGNSSNDTLLYLVTIVNHGATAALEAQFTDLLDGKTTLVGQSIQSSSGTPAVDTSAGSAKITLELGQILPGESISIGYRVRIREGTNRGQIINQAELVYTDPQSDQPIRIVSDNPDTPQADDPTVTSITTGTFIPLLIDPPLCSVSSDVSVDIALVLDRSSSMIAENKLGAAKVAAASFLAEMDLTNDQAAIISFSADVTLDQELSSNRTQLESAIASIEAIRGTAIGDGIITAAIELQSERHRPLNKAAIVLLSDGVATFGQDPVQAANEAKATGIKIFTIGLGSDVEATALRAIASTPNDYYFAPTPDALNQIYRQIARSALCTP